MRLVLDDFGTGYSSLGYLTRLPLDALKIDRSFVDGLGTERRDTAITEAIIAMSRALSLEVDRRGRRDRAPGERARADSDASSPRDSTSRRPLPRDGDHRTDAATTAVRGRAGAPVRRPSLI